MSPALPLHPESADATTAIQIDEPLDAVVYDVHPALANPYGAAYPYGPPSESPFAVLPREVYRPTPLFQFQFDFAEAHADYVVPQRFGIAAILGITTALAFLFGCLHWMNAEPGWYLFFGMQTIIICLVQMFHGRTPRKASAVAGAIVAPVFLLGTAWLFWQDTTPGAVLCTMIMSIPVGGFLGYLNGTCAAGIFLVMDKLEPYLQGQRPATSSQNTPAPTS